MNNFSECPLFEKRVYCYELYTYSFDIVNPSRIAAFIVERKMSFAIYGGSQMVFFGKSIGEFSEDSELQEGSEEKILYNFGDIRDIALKNIPAYGIYIMNFMEALNYVG